MSIKIFTRYFLLGLILFEGYRILERIISFYIFSSFIFALGTLIRILIVLVSIYLLFNLDFKNKVFHNGLMIILIAEVLLIILLLYYSFPGNRMLNIIFSGAGPLVVIYLIFDILRKIK